MTVINGYRVVITGAGAGLGLEMAETFRDAGARVFISDVRPDTPDIARAAGLSGVCCDVSDETQVSSMVRAAAAELGGIDVLVNNAGVAGPTGPVELVDPELWRHTFDVNIHGQFYCVRHALPHLRRSDNGAIVNLSSAAGRLGMAGRSPYSASKWAVVGFTKTLAIELGGDGITVNAICPGAIGGPRIERVIQAKAEMLGRPLAEVEALYRNQASLGRLVTAQDVARTALFLAGPGGRMISGQAVAVDGNTEKLY